MLQDDDLATGTVGGKLGCLFSAVVGIPLFSILFFLSFYGECGEGDPCHKGEDLRLLLIIGIVAAVSAAVGFTTRSIVNRYVRWKNE